MLNKISIFLVACACFAFAQDSYSSQTTNDSYAPPGAVAGGEPSLFISVHPFSLFILSALGVPSIYVTVEKTLGANASMIVRPGLIYLSISNDDESISILSTGITAGYRIYSRKRHRGFYVEPEISFAYANLNYDSPTNNATASVKSIGPMIMIGSKHMFGNLAFGIDAGIGYGFSSVSTSGSTSSNEIEDDLGSANSGGFLYDLNLMVGFGF